MNGNNNAYCQDNGISWLKWDHDARAKELIDFARYLTSYQLQSLTPSSSLQAARPHSINDTGELDKEAIAQSFHQAAAMPDRYGVRLRMALDR
jgi:pullulanase/glycogen debranching enzyme